MIMMKKDIFISHLDYVYNLVGEEYKQSKEGKSDYNSKQLNMILKELKSMKYWLNHREFAPYYPRGIADEWKKDDPLGIVLMNLWDEYHKL